MIKIAINGFGRIGRPVFRRIIDNHPDLKVAAINDLTDNKILSHLLKYDSLYGRYGRDVSFDKNGLIVGGARYPVFQEKDPKNLPWKKLGVDIVLECTGRFTKREEAEKHIKAGAKIVIISAPAKSDDIPGFILGINEQEFNPKKHNIVDMGSCTTNCLAPMAKILNDNFKIKSGFMTTVHSYTNDQKILDLPHSDLRRTRAAALNIIPTTTGAAKAIGKIIPKLKGKLDGIALRVPTPTVSIVDLAVEVEKAGASIDKINDLFKKAEESEELKGILKTEIEPLVSSDYIGNTYSAVIDLGLTKAMGNLIKVFGWYDNEYGYSCRLAQFADFIGRQL